MNTVWKIIPLILVWTLMTAMGTGASAQDILSPHARFLSEHQDTLPSFKTGTPTVSFKFKTSLQTNEVLGFLPYWSSAAPEDLRYDLLTTVAFFSIEIDANGNVTNTHGWPYGALVDEAHDAGARVVITITLFNSTSIATLVGSATKRANAIANIYSQIQAGLADGVNIDFEGVPVSAKANFVTFMTELKTYLLARMSNPHITVCTPAVDWTGAFDFDQLAAQTDFLMVMAYDYHWKSGDPGPVAPLYGGGIWPDISIEYTLDDYEAYMSPYTLNKVILGLPLYGYNWLSVDNSVPGEATANATSETLHNAILKQESGNYGVRHFDATTQTPYLLYQIGGWRQLWYTDSPAMGQRFAYAQNRATGGVGFWALGYEGTYDEIWDELAEYYGDDDDTIGDDDDDSGGICGGAEVYAVFVK